MYTPKEVAENYLSTCRAKAALPLGRMFLLACLAGAFVALAGVASTAAAATVGDPSLAKLISGCVFPAGLAMVIVAGSELFTGNNLMIMGVLSRVISARRMLRNWGVVYLGNFVGAALVAALCVLGLALLWIWPGWGGAAVFLVDVLLGNVPFILIQRYQRQRLLHVQARLLRRETAKTKGKREGNEGSDPELQ